MLSFRSLPPVYASAGARSTWRAAAALLTQKQRVALISTAAARLRVAYPNYNVLLTNSGTTALTLALSTTKDPSRAPLVALPAYACPDLGSAAIGANFGVVLYDVDPHTFAPNLDDVRQCIAAGATHVVVAHLCGRLVDVAAIRKLADAENVVVIEDAAQHAGATLDGIRGGALADVSILSFGRGKGLNAGGGGALLTRIGSALENLHANSHVPPTASIRELKILATSLATTVLSHPRVYAIPSSIPALEIGSTVYHAATALANISTVSAALLIGVLDDEPNALNTRRANESAYTEVLTRDQFGGIIHVTAGCDSGALRTPVRVSPSDVANVAHLGVVRMYPRTLDAYPEIKSVIKTLPNSLAGATELAQKLHTLPTHRYVTSKDRSSILRALLSRTG